VCRYACAEAYLRVIVPFPFLPRSGNSPRRGFAGSSMGHGVGNSSIWQFGNVRETSLAVTRDGRLISHS